MVISHYKLLCLSIFFIYGAFLLSPYFNYIVGEGIYLWHIVIIIFSPVVLFFSFKYFKRNYLVFCYSIFLLFLVVFQLIMDFDKASFIIRSTQFFLSFSLFISIVYFSDKYTGKKKEYFDYLFKSLIKIIVLFALLQFVIRIIDPSLILSEYQNYRTLFGLLKQVSSFFYEPRGLAQFLLVSLFCILFLGLKIKKIWLYLIILTTVLTFSLGAIIVLFVITSLFMLRDIKPIKLVQSSVITIFLFTAFILSPPGEFISKRIQGVADNMGAVPIMVILENSYKLNHVDFYHQYSDQFEKDYGFHGGSETVSIFAEISYFYLTLKNKTFFGSGLVDQSRYVSLNAIVDFFSRFGLVGTLLFIYIFGWNKGVKFSLIIFLIFFSALDGALAKPQVWFLLGVLYYYNSVKKLHFVNLHSLKFQKIKPKNCNTLVTI